MPTFTTTSTPTPTPTRASTTGETTTKPRRTVIELVTTFVDGSVSIGKVTKTEDIDESTPTTTKRGSGGSLYTSTYTQDGEVKIVTGTMTDGMNSGASSSLLSAAAGALVVSAALALSIASLVF
ncbi:hypothetical protein GGH95_004919 [Coemansia sp. RSA 1836]|nr:hypothetical protein IWW47_000978 [Coemansia sp. RSA 2052]KAJ2559645.1 hypothetical protein GGH95_004919 [Coemansia sp. RSA 1836]